MYGKSRYSCPDSKVFNSAFNIMNNQKNLEKERELKIRDNKNLELLQDDFEQNHIPAPLQKTDCGPKTDPIWHFAKIAKRTQNGPNLGTANEPISPLESDHSVNSKMGVR